MTHEPMSLFFSTRERFLSVSPNTRPLPTWFFKCLSCENSVVVSSSLHMHFKQTSRMEDTLVLLYYAPFPRVVSSRRFLRGTVTEWSQHKLRCIRMSAKCAVHFACDAATCEDLEDVLVICMLTKILIAFTHLVSTYKVEFTIWQASVKSLIMMREYSIKNAYQRKKKKYIGRHCTI